MARKLWCAAALAATFASAQAQQKDGNAFNPAISLILQGTAATSREDPEAYRIDGFAPSGGEVGPAPRGFGLGESELVISANVDPYFRGHLVAALKAGQWSEAVWCAGVLSHYATDPVHPFHTAQSEAENAIHRAAEWSINRSYDSLRTDGERHFSSLRIAKPDGAHWLKDLVIQGAERSNPYYEKLIAHYNIHAGVVDPPSGLDNTSRKIIAELLIYASKGFALILDEAIAVAGQVPLPPYIAGKRAPDDAFCSTLIAGFLETATGEEIFFEGRGFALSNQNEDVWSYTASLRFDEPDTPYEWLRHTPAVWVGTLDAKRRRARYRVYFPTRAPKSGN